MSGLSRVIVAVALVGASAAAGQKAEVPNVGPRPRVASDLRSNPPVAQRVGVRLLEQEGKEGNALLLVEFAPAVPAPAVLTLDLENEKVLLRDDGKEPDERSGDGIHSAWVRLDLERLTAQQRALIAAKAPLPVFSGRELIATASARELGAAAFSDLRKIPIVPSRKTKPEPRRSRELARLVFPIATRFRPGSLIPIFPLVDPSSVDAAKSLMITDPGVITDPGRTFDPCTGVGTPMGKWTFGHLMEQLANTPATGTAPAVFSRRWLRRWEIAQTVNDFSVAPRPQVVPLIVDIWPKVGMTTTLDLAKAPFKLVAIVNRIDLRHNTIYGGGSAGEGRFIFALTDASCNPTPFLVIFEYGIQRSSCSAVKAWGQQWFDLGALPIGSPAFNAALEAITVQFTEAGTNPSQLPNRSSLNQLRTNEIAIGSPWELREFRLASDDSDIGHLREVTVKQTPDASLNLTATLEDYANTNAATILIDAHSVPIEFPSGAPFLGGAAPVPPSFWDGRPPQPSPALVSTPNLRHHLSLNSCNACHSAETATGFTHVSQTGALSGFLTGVTVTDPAGEPTSRMFDDLLRRQQSLAQLLSQPCIFHVFFDPLRMVH